MNIKDLLPIGSIVILKKGETPLMISGFKQMDGAGGLFKKSKEFDYCGLIYPHGELGDGMRYLFNHEDIEKIIFRGYEDEERDNFLEYLANWYANKE